MAVVVVACSSTTATTTISTVTTLVTTTTTAAATTTTTMPTTTTLDCQAYAQTFIGIITPILDLIAEAQATAGGILDGSLTPEEGADTYFILADSVAQIGVELEEMGEPPPNMAESIRLVIRGVDLLAQAYEVGSRGARNLDASLLEESLDLSQEGNALVGQASEVLEPCP